MRKFVSIAALAGLLLTACGGGSNASAATVGDSDITVATVEELISTDGDTVTKEQFAGVLGSLIQVSIIGTAVDEDFGITFTDEEIAAQADSVYEEFASEGEAREEFLVTRGITEDFLELFALQRLIDERLREMFAEDVEDPTDEEIDAARDELATTLTTVCASHILVATEDEASEILTRLDDGDDFAELAAEFGTDGTAQQGGELGCSSPLDYVEPFAEAIMVAPVGEVYDEIVETQFGFHVIEVTDRQEPNDDDLAAGLRDTAAAEELEAWFTSTLDEADVTVEEEYGTWDPATATVIPPTTE